MSLDSLFIFAIVIFLGAITKSAQLPFSSWLPAAMAAPTPVSSLVHSSTLVTAGIYLLIRFNYLLREIYFLLSPISLVTMVLAGACAVYELDFKKVVAMSTLSQLGFIVFSISSGFWLLSFLHITFHAFFKSCLFLSTGSMIHLLLGDQDSRNFGSLGLSNFSKILFSMRSLSLIGFPFSLGFYSKDRILGEMLFSLSRFSSFMFAFGCCFTVAYRVRLVSIAFYGFPTFFSNLLFKEDKFFYFPIVSLYFFCIFVGNFFFLNFLPPVLFSFLDFFVGIFIIMGGFLFFFISPFFYFLNNFLSTISFLSIVTSNFFSRLDSGFNFKFEYMWGELIGGKGVLGAVSAFSSWSKRAYRVNFFAVGVISLLIFVVLM